MDPELLRQKEAFKKRALDATRKNQEIREAASKARQDVAASSQTSKPPKKKKKKSVLKRPTSSRESKSPAKNLSHLSENPRRLLKAVIDIMRERHSSQDDYDPLTFEQILEKIGCSDIKDELKQTLLYDLKNNTKTDYNPTAETFQFKPALGLHVRNRKQLARYLRENDLEGRGGTLLSEIREAVRDPDKAMKKLDTDGEIYRITRQDKEEVIFYKNSHYELEEPLSEEFKAHWHRVSVEGMTDDDIEKYLTNCGIGAMGGEGRKRKAPGELKKAKKRSRATKILNVHLDDTVLKDYSEDHETK